MRGSRHALRFGDCELDTDVLELRRDGERVGIEPQAFDVLVYLLERRTRVVPKDELMDNVWGGRFVSEAAVTSRIKQIRRAVGDDGQAQEVVRTHHGRRYRFVGRAGLHAVQCTGHLGRGRLWNASTRGPPAVGQPAAAAPGRALLPDCRRRDLAYAWAGSGPPLVKAANWLTHIEYDLETPVWRHWYRDLAQEHRVLRYDERRCGLSHRDVEDFSVEAWVDDLEAVVNAAGLERFPLLGVSQGGAVAVEYAARHPERVTKLILYGAFVKGPSLRAKTEAEAERRT